MTAERGAEVRMRNQKRQRVLPLILAAAVLAFSAAGAAELPEAENAEPEKEYELAVRIAGPVEVTISHAADKPAGEKVIDFGADASEVGNVLSSETHMLSEESAEEIGEDVPVRTITLTEGPDYDVRLEAARAGSLTYTVMLRDPSGGEEDRELHCFENIPLTENTVLTTVANAGGQNTLTVYEKSADGLKPYAAYGSGRNGGIITVNEQTVLLAGILLLVIIALPLLFRRKRRTVILQKPVMQRKG